MEGSVFAVIDTNVIVSALSVICEYRMNLERTAVEDESFPDPEDIVFYEVKMSKADAYLVTGNIKHFPREPRVVTPKEMVEILEQGLSTSAANQGER